MDHPHQNEDREEDESSSNKESEGNAEQTTQQTLRESEDFEQVEAKVEEVGAPQPAEEVDSLATFSEQEGKFSVRIIPVVRNAGADWRVNVYAEGVQGPIYQATGKITDEAADQLGMTRRLQTRVNEALEYANQNLHIPEVLGNQKRDKRSLHDLEVMMEDE